MKMVNYTGLLAQTINVPPYRGTVDRFPIGDRKQNNKYFFVREADGKKEFHIVYGNNWRMREITEAEFRLGSVGGTVHTSTESDGKVKHTKYESYPNIVGIVRDDNTFEFIKDGYSQGDRAFLTGVSGPTTGWFCCDVRRGGMVFNDPYRVVFHPIWKGMRVDCTTLKPNVPYEVVTYAVDRKKSRPLLAPYEHFFKVSEVMLKSMSMDNLLDTAIEVVEGVYGVNKSKKYISNPRYLEQAVKYIDDAPLDAFILYALGYDVGRLEYSMRYRSATGTRSLNYSQMDGLNAETMFAGVKRRLGKDLYKQHIDVFKTVTHAGGTKYPSCEWGTQVMVNGQHVEQYS
jgi:hypothetical protein